MKEKKVGQLVYNTSREGVIVLNEGGIIQTVNPSIEEMFGYSKKELKDLDVLMIMPELLLESECLGKKSKPTFLAQDREIRGINKNGIEFPVLFSCNHFETEGHGLIMLQVRDISKLKEREKQLKSINAKLEIQIEKSEKAAYQNENLFKKIAQNFPNGLISVLDRELNFIYLEGMELQNPEFVDKVIKGKNFLQKIDPDRRYSIKKKLLSAFKGEAVNFELMVSDQVFLVNAVGLDDPNQVGQRILVVTQNVTNLKVAEKETMKSLRKEKELSEVKSRFVATASHEFKTPLTTILNSAVVLSRVLNGIDVDPRTLKQVDRIKSTVKQLTNILEDVLSLQKLDEGRVNAHFAEVDIPEFTSGILDELKDISKRGQIIQYDHKGSKKAFLDHFILHNIYMNLVSNAIKYSPEGGNILVRTEIKNSWLHIEVEDDGIGIPEEEQHHIFDRFFRAKNVMEIQGTGLGLNIVRKYIEIVKGNIEFKSVEGKGTVFYLSIPLEIASVELKEEKLKV